MSDAAAEARSGAPNWQRLLLAVCVAQATSIVGFDFTLPFIPLYLQHDLGIHGLGQTALWAGLIGFAPAIPATVFGPLWGRLADRFGYRTMLLRAMGSAALLLTLMGLAPSPVVLLVLRMVQGALTGTVFSAQALVAASVPKQETARSMGLLQMSVYIGATFGPVGGGILAGAFGYRPAFVAAGLLVAAATVVVFAFVQEPRIRFRSAAPGDTARPSMLKVLAVPAFATAAVLTLVVQLAGTSLMPIMPLFVQDLLHSSRQVSEYTGLLFALSGVTAAVGSYTAGRLHRHVSITPLLVASIALSSLLLLPQAFVTTFVMFLALRCLASFAFGALFSLVSTSAAMSSPAEAKGTAFGLLGAASSLGFGSGPLLGGFIAAQVGVRPVFFLAGIILGVLPAGLFLARRFLPPAVRAFRPRPARTAHPDPERGR